MNNNTQTLLHLSLIPNIGPATTLKIIKKLFEQFIAEHKHPELSSTSFDLKRLYAMKASELTQTFGISQNASRIIATGLANNKLLDDELLLIEKYNINVTSFLDTNYPESLKEIHHPPLMLYCKGTPIKDSQNRLAIVGSRNATDYAQQAISQLIPDLVSRDFTIVSGGARGVDTMAHTATVDHSGTTIVVFGSGLLQTYPKENRDLFKKIVQNGGTLVSPFSLNTPPTKGNFPARNRVIAGLSPQGCLVVQAAKRSGALITAQFSLDQGRQIFAIPGPVHEELSAGCHALLKDGAKLVETAIDILEEFGIEDGASRIITLRSSNSDELLEKHKKPTHSHPLLTHLTHPISLDELCSKTKQTIADLQDQLFELQLEGKVEQNFAGLWHIL